MRRSLPLLAICFVTAMTATLAAPALAQTSANSDICAANDESAVSLEQRIAACTGVIADVKDAPQALSTALVNRGSASWTINKTQAAFADFDRAIALDPKNARAFRERSNAFRSVGRLDRALADANEAVRLDPKFSLAFMDRGSAHYFKGEMEPAIADYSESVRLDPKRSRALTHRGAAYKKLGRVEQALADESEAIKLDPQVPEYFDNRGLSYQENGDYDRAIADYNEAIRLAPQANFLTNRGDSYQFKGDLDHAIADYDRALKLNPGFYLAYNNRGAAFHRKGDLERSIADYEQALRINPQMDSAAENLAAVRQQRDRRDTASQRLLPTFDCGSAKRAVEKAICSDPDLSRLDRQIDDAYKAALAKLNRKGVARLRDEQREFNIERNKSFGRPDYQLKREMEKRLLALRGMTTAN